ncbi:hypothetical protein FACS1894184_15060 [Clostridia bacterium]|nr:hypothetical protein FACS1894184_15060 [Clostridia bacterium]
MASRIFEGPISLHHGTAAAFLANNPVLVRGEMGVELDTYRYKIGDGETPWNDLPYASGSQFLVNAGAPTTENANYGLGSIWFNTVDERAYLLVAVNSGDAVWQSVATVADLADLGGGDMLRSEFATTGITGKVDAAQQADKLSAARSFTLTGDVSGTVSSDLSGNVTIATELDEVGTAGTYTKVTTDDAGRITSGSGLAASDIPDLTLSKITDAGTAAAKDVGVASGNVPVLDSAGKLASSVIPSTAIVDRFEAANVAALIGLTDAEVGDIAVLPDASLYMLVHSDSSVAANWIKLTNDPNAVTSVNGQSGPNVVLTSSEIAEGLNLYHTAERVQAIIEAAHVGDLVDGANVLMSTDTYAWDGGQEV